ncbi:hypothetical protein GCM10023095_26040 [Pseudaeromonas paramecii]|uniref:Silver efflux pump n=2 Tax=Pseudaeromonas paramecii TaxID=2138166 RepID=A0ABP8QG59_9GAMM
MGVETVSTGVKYAIFTSTRKDSMNKVTGVALAAAAAALFGSITPSVQANEAPQVKCMGINACKGQSKCQTAQNACAGQNACKGHGWLLVPSAQACVDQGGSVLE